MSKKADDLTAVLETVESAGERSPLFWWMVKHHDDLAAKADGNRMRWVPLCATFASLGFTDTAGNPHSKRGAREVWLKARSYVAKRKATSARASTARAQPSRLPTTWRPPVAEPARAAEPPRDASPNTVPARTAPRELTEEARATLAALDRQLDHRDRFVNPPKRKD